MGRRRKTEQAFSLFAFQDIITSVMGIVILVLLVVALELASRQLLSPVVQQQAVQNDLSKGLDIAREQVATLRATVANDEWSELAGLTTTQLNAEDERLRAAIPALEVDLKRLRDRMQQLQAANKEAQAEAKKRESDVIRLELQREQIGQIKAEIDQLINSDLVFFKPTDASGLIPWIVQISSDHILAAAFGSSQPPEPFHAADETQLIRQFARWASSRDPQREYFVLFIKPGGVKVANELESQLRRRFKVGIDLLTSSQSAIDPSGAQTTTPTP